MSSTLKARLSWVPGVLVATALAAVALQLAAADEIATELRLATAPEDAAAAVA